MNKASSSALKPEAMVCALHILSLYRNRSIQMTKDNALQPCYTIYTETMPYLDGRNLLLDLAYIGAKGGHILSCIAAALQLNQQVGLMPLRPPLGDIKLINIPSDLLQIVM